MVYHGFYKSYTNHHAIYNNDKGDEVIITHLLDDADANYEEIKAQYLELGMMYKGKVISLLQRFGDIINIQHPKNPRQN